MPPNAQGMTYGPPIPQPPQPSQQQSIPHPNRAQLSGDVRAQVINVLTTTANSCLVEQGYDPSLDKRIQDLEHQRQRVFEDNKNLKMMLDNERSKHQHLSKPHNELISIVVNSQNDLKRISTENMALRTENSAISAKLKSLERENQNGLAHQRLQLAYSDLLTAYQNISAKLLTTEQQLSTLGLHCRGCPEYARQIQAFRAQSGAQLQMVSPTQLSQFLQQQQQQPQQGPPPQPHEQQRRASAPDTNLGPRPPSQPRTPAMAAPATGRMGPPFASWPDPAPATQLRVSTSAAPGQNSLPVSSPTTFGAQNNGPRRPSAPPAPGFNPAPASMISSSMPMTSPRNTLQQFVPAPISPQTLVNGPQFVNTNQTPQMPHGTPPQMQRVPHQAPTHSRPSSSLGHALDPNFNAQIPRNPYPPNKARTSPVFAPNGALPQQLTPVAVSATSAPPMASLQHVGTRPDPWSMVPEHIVAAERPPSVISISSRSSSVGSATKPQFQQQQHQDATNVPPNMPAFSVPAASNSNSQSVSSGVQLPPSNAVATAPPLAPPPSLSSMSSASNPGDITGQSQLAPRPPSNPPSSITRIAENSTDMNVDSIATGVAAKRTSVVLGEPSTLPEGKKMRLSVDADTKSPSPAPVQAAKDGDSGGVAAAAAAVPEKQEDLEEEDEDEDEEDIAVGPDGLRLISDCLANLFEADGAGGRTCRLCKTRHARGLIAAAPAPFVNAPDEALVEHCTAEHEQVWNELRHDV
ncbi:hypothetical protein EST38_g3911 [Candolleomyces aberdarensis]|uniref:Uncharacterized protein n=1 Tax=Candolleomyces aberdarensis TaxID=2316362 RepID=A0A4Q2DR07_9AGAR|nr:hypothetical protein EST38_g3911 [Candolleomyces aberdarensis]